MNKVFISDGLLRKSLSAVRSIGQLGAEVTVAEKTKWNMSGFSKYCRRSLCYPDPSKQPDLFTNWVDQHLSKWDVWFPMDDATMDLAITNSEKWKRMCKMVLPPKESYLLLRDKFEAVRLAEKAGLHCPQTVLLNTYEEVVKESESFTFPVVAKPRFSSGSRGIRKFERREDLIAYFRDWPEGKAYPMVQAYIPHGEKYDVCLLFDGKSVLKAHFIQKEIRHFPLQKGPSTAQESVYHDSLLDQALAFMKQVRWEGIVELEFMMHGEKGIPVFMEANPRFWNSLACAVESGVDFPAMLYEMALGREVKTIANYEEGVVCRNLLPGDLLYLIASRNRRKHDPPIIRKKGRRIVDDVISMNDPMPILGFCLTCFKFLWSKESWFHYIKRN